MRWQKIGGKHKDRPNCNATQVTIEQNCSRDPMQDTLTEDQLEDYLSQVSIVIVNYNSSDAIPKCLSSLSDKITPIIIDNASDDEPHRYLDQFIQSARILFSKNNLGFSKGNNYGISLSSSPYILLLNADVSISTATIIEMLRYMESRAFVGAVAPRLYYPDGRPQDYVHRFPKLWFVLAWGTWLGFFINRKVARGGLGRLYTYGDVDFSHGVWKVDQPAGACILLRRNAFTKLDERLFVYFSDVALCEEIVRKDYEIHMLSDLRATHTKHYSTRGKKLNSLFERDMLNYFKLHRSNLHYFYAYFFLKLDARLSRYFDRTRPA